MEQSPFREANSRSACQEVAHLYGTQSSITVFTRTCHWSLSWTTWVPSLLSQPVSLKTNFNIILPSTPCLPSCVSPLGFSKILYAFLFALMRTTWPIPLVLDSITSIIFVLKCKLRNSSLCNILHPHVTSSLFGQNVLHSCVCCKTVPYSFCFIR